MTAIEKITEILPGAFHIFLKQFPDKRGCLVKTPLASELEEIGIVFDARDEFYSISAKDVIRGMHFQLPPHHHEKVVYCPAGSNLDVLLDLRRGSGYGAVRSVILTPNHPSMLFIPTGVAHGFKSLQEGSVMVYKTSTEHVPSHDCGILYNSIDFDWECPRPVISGRDLGHQLFNSFISPFDRV